MLLPIWCNRCWGNTIVGVVGYYNVPNKLAETTGAGGNGTPITTAGTTTTNSEGYSYVDDVPTVPLHGRHSSAHHKSSSSHSSSHREHSQQNRARRTQRRVTHNEKRYHSGQSLVRWSSYGVLDTLAVNAD